MWSLCSWLNRWVLPGSARTGWRRLLLLSCHKWAIWTREICDLQLCTYTFECSQRRTNTAGALISLIWMGVEDECKSNNCEGTWALSTLHCNTASSKPYLCVCVWGRERENISERWLHDSMRVHVCSHAGQNADTCWDKVLKLLLCMVMNCLIVVPLYAQRLVGFSANIEVLSVYLCVCGVTPPWTQSENMGLKLGVWCAVWENELPARHLRQEVPDVGSSCEAHRLQTPVDHLYCNYSDVCACGFFNKMSCRLPEICMDCKEPMSLKQPHQCNSFCSHLFYNNLFTINRSAYTLTIPPLVDWGWGVVGHCLGATIAEKSITLEWQNERKCNIGCSLHFHPCPLNSRGSAKNSRIYEGHL